MSAPKILPAVKRTAFCLAALLWLAPSAGATPTELPAGGSLTLPRPDLSAMDEVVRRKVETMQTMLQQQIDRRQSGTPGPGLSEGFGTLGHHFHAYRLLDAAETCYVNSQRLKPQDYRWPHFLGLVRNSQGDFEAAVADYRRALELRPNDFPTLIRLGDALLELNLTADAERIFAQAQALDPQAAVTHFGRGRVAAANGDVEAAVASFEKALELQPEASAVHYPLAQAYRKLGNMDKAQEHLGKRGDDKVGFPDPLGSQIHRLATAAAFDIVLSLAREGGSVSEEEFLGFALGQFGDVKGAIEQLQQGLQIERYSASDNSSGKPAELARIHYVLGGLLVNDGRDQDAVQEFSSAIELDPSLVDTRIKLGNALVRLERAEEAMATYGAVLAAHPEHLAALLKQAAVLISLERDSEAEPLLDKLIGLEPEHSEALVRLATIYQRRGEVDRAVDIFRRVSRFDLRLPEAVQVRYRLAGGLRRQGTPEALEEALAEYRWIVEADPEFVPGLSGLARLLGQLGRFEESAAIHAQWVAKEPRSFDARLGEVTALTFAGRHLEVKQRLEAGIEELVDNLVLKDILARHLAASPDHAVRDGARAVELALEVYQRVPSAESIETLAMAYAQAGRFEEAIEWQQHLANKAREAGDSALIERIQGNLARYQAKQVCCAGGS